MGQRVWLRQELLAAGFSVDEVRRGRQRGAIVAVRRGAYVGAGEDPPDDLDTHRLRIEAAVRQLGTGAVVSHVSAAVLHGLPVWGLSLDRVHATRDRSSGARTGRDVHLHAAAFDADEITTVGGVLVTCPARTVVDIARSAPFDVAVAVADAALHRPRDRPPLVTADELAVAVARSARRPGTTAARRAIAFADGRSESVGESRSRVAIDMAGLPAPVLQWEVQTSIGLCRVDFYWPEHRLAGEFDGRVKYGRLLKPGQHPGDAVYAEKRREDALRAEHMGVTRWGWPDIPAFTVALGAKLAPRRG
ncbi:hypothetical protein ACQEVB_37685 [Pseudonocardia sp. CA-107938]|uniref:hypothetical protein n=1 Tax=Pseudonocardia sp. CA-107938 TaxID=3240021 RepID=UPI003D8D0BF8